MRKIAHGRLRRRVHGNEVAMPNRASLLYQARYALEHPSRIPTHLRRLARDVRLRMTSADHVGYYRAVMRADTSRDADAAVGSKSRESWLRIGQLQFDYLIGHGLKPADRMLEIGCGNLRAGWRFIEYLEPGCYYGIDISPDILLAAKRTLTDRGLQDKLPYLTLVEDLRFDFLPSDFFSVVHAHSVFSHSPLKTVEQCFAHVGRILAPGGFFDLTFDRTSGTEHHVLWEDFYYRTETLTALAGTYGLHARFMEDWEELPHRQSKIRITRAPAEDAEPAHPAELDRLDDDVREMATDHVT
jgi:SAM-dependent methyltransferase